MRVLAGALLVAFASACSRPSPKSDKPAAPAAVSGAVEPVETEAGSTISKTAVTLYFPSEAADALSGEARDIVETSGPTERGAQILAELLNGPKQSGHLAAAPAGTTLRRLWVREDGTAYADFSDELANGMTGGSADELLTVYAIVDSLTENVPEIKRVNVLIAGRERDTLGGHVDIRFPLGPDRKLLEKPAAKE